MKIQNYKKIVQWDKSSKLVNLNQLWKAVGSPPNKDPRKWLEQKQSAEFLFALEKKLNVALNDILKTVSGRNGGIWGHWQVALAYAKYLDPNLHIQVNECAKSYIEEEINPEKSIDRAIDNWKKQGKSDPWIKARIEGKYIRHQFTHTLSQHGIEKSYEYARCTDAINENVLGGTAQKVKKEMGLTQSANLRDNLSRVKLAALGLAEALAEEDIEENQRQGYNQCVSSCYQAGSRVKLALN